MAAALELYEASDTRQEHLVLSHMPMVKRVAIHLKARIPPFMDLDELIQVGMLGLIEAARSYDPTLGHAFENYALRRVRGAMLDEVRRLSYLPRSAVSFNRSESEAQHQLAAELGRQPTQSEIAEFMGLSLDALHHERGQAHRSETHSIEDMEDEVMALADDASQQPQALVEHAEFMEAVTEAIEGLPDREKLIMSLYYVEELNLKEIGEILGVSESRVSQLLSATVKKLRSTLRV
jgi:RNA polymerase sigma factor for flagellar operon FliA